ncbi:hypothetical protein HHI36_014378 [Cryptolaemus montrouzieri]|uniref:Uncharacterized protein n=1 Tax=Cryptolaemus montrouzieri TaxID=559131 RepID=A0ABD2N2L9_9CUCU
MRRLREAKNDQNCGKTTHGFYTTITLRLIMASLSVPINTPLTLSKNSTNTIEQPPNLPDLAPCDFFLFGRLKKPLRRMRFSSREEIIEKIEDGPKGHTAN